MRRRAVICTLPNNPCPTAHSTQAKQEAARSNFATSSTPETRHHPTPHALFEPPRTSTLSRSSLTDRIHSLVRAFTLSTMVSRIAALLLSGVALLQVHAQASLPSTDLIGTWTSKSNGTLTGDVPIPVTQSILSSKLTQLPGLLRPRRRAPH
jgi:hypothetical protein